MASPGHTARLVSALADPDRLRVFCRIALAGPPGLAEDELAAVEPKARRQLPRLLADQLVTRSPGGVLTARTEAFAQALHPQPAPEEERRSGEPDPAVRNLFSADGRLAAMPVRRELRQALLRYLTGRMFEAGPAYSEAEVNIAIKQYWDDYPALRRYLIDEGLLMRSADGSSYRVAA